MHFSKEIGESLTYQFAQAAGEMKRQGREIISLGLGEPDFKTPDYVVDATVEALHNGFTHYSPSQGLPELRNKIAEFSTNHYGVQYDASQIIILPGIKAAVYDSLAAILEPFDEVINITPYYVSYVPMIKLAEPTAEIINVPVTRNFTLDMEKLKAAFNKNTKVILVNSPNNPTGMMFSKAEVEEIIKLALENDTYIIADEVYETLSYEDNTFFSFGSYPEIKNRLILCNGFSKSYAMTGWRLGYAIGPNEIIRKMNKMQQHINTNTCTFIQKGAVSIFEHKPDHLKPYVEELKRRVDNFDKAVNGMKCLKGIRPKAGFFYFMDISETHMDSNSFCVKLLRDTGIATTPGLAFGHDWDDHVRVSLAVPMATLDRAIKLMSEFVKNNF